MKKILFLVLLAASVVRAQTNIAFTKIKVVPNLSATNFNHITLGITNINPNQLYALLFAPYLNNGSSDFAPYISFSSPSNSITIERDTAKIITVRFYKPAWRDQTGWWGGYFVDDYSEWDYHDPYCEQCEQQQFMSDMRVMLTRFGLIEPPPPVPQEILDIINPPPLRSR